MLKFLRKIFILPLVLSVFFVGVSTNAAPLPSDLSDDVLFLAATMWGETKDNNIESMQIVANTIMNRKKYYEQQNGGNPISIKQIVSNTDQFASWQGKNWDASEIIKNMSEYQGSDKEAWETCINYAKLALNNKLPDLTDGATGYYSKSAQETPEWARGATNTTTFNDTVVVRGAKMEDLVDSNNNVIAKGGTSSQDSNSWNSLQDTSASPASGDSCGGVESVSRDISSATNSGHGIISDKTMQNMTNMMDRIYKNLGRIFMLGHGLLCYATKVAYACIGLDVPGVVSACWIKTPNMSFFICGLAVYLAAFMMSVAIGMYFIDICFKLGFAILYLPVAIALWPFAPTRSKFGEVLGMIIHNAMLYALMSIGLTYAIILIYNGVLGDASNWTSFWNAIEKESSEILSENFSLSSTRLIVVLFSLIFGFKIIASSVNNYLNYFFSDGLMGGQSPMHYLGTQAIGLTGGALVGKLGGWTVDVASTQTGKAIEGVGNTLVDMSQGDAGILGKAASSVVKPVQKGLSYLKRFGNGEFNDDSTIAPTGSNPKGPAPTGGSSSTSSSASTSSATTENEPISTSTDDNGTNTIREVLSDINQATTPDENTLRPNNIISKTSNAVGDVLGAAVHPVSTYRTMSNLATQGINSENSTFQNGKIILSNTGKVVFRKFTPDAIQQGLSSDNSFMQNAGILGKNTLAEGAKIGRATVSDSVGFFGRSFQGIGKSMQNNYGKENSIEKWLANQKEKEKEDEIREQEENLVNQTHTDNYDENS